LIDGWACWVSIPVATQVIGAKGINGKHENVHIKKNVSILWNYNITAKDPHFR
jgi:hypothetical protein